MTDRKPSPTIIDRLYNNLPLIVCAIILGGMFIRGCRMDAKIEEELNHQRRERQSREFEKKVNDLNRFVEDAKAEIDRY